MLIGPTYPGSDDLVLTPCAWLASGIRVLIALALLTSVVSMVMAGPRVYALMAADGLFPRQLRFAHGADGLFGFRPRAARETVSGRPWAIPS